MVTLEDLRGSIQLLCMNENYDKYRTLLELNQAVMVIGEVNNGEDKPKIFPQEIIRLDDAPKRYTKQVYFRLHSDKLSREQLESARDLALAHPGKCPLFLGIKQPGGQVVFIETHERYSVAPSREFEKAANDLLGESTYYVTVDNTLPERNGRKWEKSGEG
jgi:DNA polymerase III subunit alpha